MHQGSERRRGRGDVIKGEIGRFQDVPVPHVKLSLGNNRIWDRPSSCLGLCRFYHLRRSSNRTCDPEAPHRHACTVSGLMVGFFFLFFCFFAFSLFRFFGHMGPAGDLRFISRWANNGAVLSPVPSCQLFYEDKTCRCQF